MLTYSIIACIISIIVWKSAKRKTPKKDTTKEDAVIETIKMRYAKGKITKVEYEEKKKDLKDSTLFSIQTMICFRKVRINLHYKVRKMLLISMELQSMDITQIDATIINGILIPLSISSSVSPFTYQIASIAAGSAISLFSASALLEGFVSVVYHIQEGEMDF